MSKINAANEFSCNNCSSNNLGIVQHLTDVEISEISEKKDCGYYKKGQLVFMEGQRPRGLFCVNSGKIKITKIGSEGKEQILRLAKTGDIMGYRALLGEDVYSCSAYSIEDSRICFIPKSNIFKLIENNPKFSLKMIKLLTGELRSAEQHVTDMAQKPVRERVAEALLFIKETYGYENQSKTINAKLSREELANMVGTATESVIRTLSEFKHDGIIDIKGKNIELLNEEKLVAIANIVY
jgi:CRP/FNR family transcriptional regulator